MLTNSVHFLQGTLYLLHDPPNPTLTTSNAPTVNVDLSSIPPRGIFHSARTNTVASRENYRATKLWKNSTREHRYIAYT